VSSRAQSVAAAFVWACLAELDAPKPGNVHAFAGGHRMTIEDFVRSANAAAGPLSAAGSRVGARILGAVEATSAAVGANTNLGIVLLCAPLAAAAEAAEADVEAPQLRAALGRVLRELDVEDATLAFRAIVKAAPAGLGHSSRHDVFTPATVSLLQAMAEAADRDRVARQYTTDFADVFELGLPSFEAALNGRAEQKWATLAVFLSFLAAFPDTHIARKLGAERAAEVQREAKKFQTELRAAEQPVEILPALLAWDAALKAEGINPGTSADLTVATLFAYRLRTVLPSLPNSG
jgi:triphosphoribosyl-dephospho-CoA synthase